MSCIKHYLDTRYDFILYIVSHTMYRSVSTSQKKLKLFHGTSSIINDYIVNDTISTDIVIYCCTGILPHLRLQQGHKVPADRVCSKLNVNL